MNGHWRILRLLNTLQFNKDLVLFGPGIICDNLSGPYVIANHLSGTWYDDILKRTIPLLFEDVPFNFHKSIWFQHDSAPSIFHAKFIIG
jgi:hypothetical protein